MKIDKIPDYIDPSLNLEQIRDECHDLIKKRAYVSAGAAIVPIPFLTWQSIWEFCRTLFQISIPVLA